ncbi:MAG: gliding motility-associated C-terminal domain-containing protein, partial [Flavobacteriales bacterium]|nr:gliding motility-associated C-terminal domain-containing protein [Flavobacteriales bacterium]
TVPSGGLPPYVLNWYGQDPLQLQSGTFNYTVTDANQCTFNSSVTLYDPLNTTSIINEYNSSCFGENDGAASITMLGGVTPPGTVSLLPYCASNPLPDFDAQAATYIQHVQLAGDNSSLIDNNTIGINDFYEDYTATMYAEITEGNLYTINVTIGDLSAGSYNGGAKVFIDYNIDGDFLDAGEDIGIIPVQATAGTSVPLNFNVPTTGAFGATRMRVVAWGTYDFTTPNDITPCESPAAGSWANPWFGATEDYSIVLNAPSFSATYLWDDGTITDSIPNLSPGTYYVIITDTETGCPIQDSAVITEPQEITFNPTIIDISCNTFSDGEVVLAPTGGNGGPYNINWNGNDSTALADGSYTVTVTDPSTITLDNTVACFNDTTIVMVEPAYFSADFSVSDLSICSGDPLNLEIDFNSNGIAPFTINYTANGPSYSEGPVNNLGIYTFTENPLISTTYSISSIVDDNGCINQNTINNIAVNVNPLPNMNISVNPNPICVGDNSALNLNGTTGTPPYNLDYTISDANGTTTATETVGSGGFTSSVSPIITTDYTLTSVTDDSTCVSPLSTVATLVVNEIPQLITTYSNEICEGDMVQIGLDFTAGTPPFNVDYTFNGTNTSTMVNFTTDELTLIATNPSNITINSITGVNCFKQVDENIQISVNPLPISNLSGDGSLCDDGSFMYIKFETVSGLALYDIVYTDGNDNFTLTNIGNIDSIPTSTIGTYTLVSVTDQKGCEAISLTGQANVNINPLPDVSIIAYPIITEITDPLINFIDKSTYLNSTPGIWDFGDGSGQISNFGQLDHIYADTGVYHVSLTTVSDSGCTNTAYQTIIINPTFTIYIPNAFTPNNDLDNDYFLPIVDGVKEYELSIYDRQGQRVFRTEEYTNEYCNSGCKAAWDGKINNSSDFGTIGVYVYHIVITDINGKLKSYEGAVTLIR